MQLNKPKLIIEISEKKFIFLVLKFNHELNPNFLEIIDIKSEGVTNGKITDANKSYEIIYNQMKIIEDKINFTFKDVSIVLDQNNAKCINISGSKKLYGRQVQKDDISFVLNNLKKLILENNKNLSLIHLFNSKFNLDNTEVKTLPIGLHGNFYNQQLTFFLLPTNDLKNLNLVMNKCNLNIEKIVLKNFVEGTELINRYKENKNFFNIKIEKDKSSISFFSNSSYVYNESFNFGSKIILNDICKLCSLDYETVEKILLNEKLDKFQDENKKELFLNKSYFNGNLYRKISISHLNEIISARINEMLNIIYIKNINLVSCKQSNQIINIKFLEDRLMKNLHSFFENNFNSQENINFLNSTNNSYTLDPAASAELIAKGWEKEAIPIVLTKKSIISRIFSSFFN